MGGGRVGVLDGGGGGVGGGRVGVLDGGGGGVGGGRVGVLDGGGRQKTTSSSSERLTQIHHFL